MSLSHSEKRNRLTWALLIFFVALLAAIVYLQMQASAALTQNSRNADDISQITIQRKDQPSIALEKEDQWWITSPLRIAANDQRIIPLLTVYTNPDIGYPIDSVDLVATGLQDPEVRLSFNDYQVAIGDKAIDESKRHALHGDRVRFVPDWVLPLLQGGVSAMANLTVFGDELTSLALDSKKLDDDSLAQARAITAQQLVLWPREEKPTILSEHSASVGFASGHSAWTLFKTDRYVAVLPENSNYAYVVPLADMPWLSE